MLSDKRRVLGDWVGVLLTVFLLTLIVAPPLHAQDEDMAPLDEDMAYEDSAEAEETEDDELLGPDIDVDGLLAADEDVLAGSGYSYDPEGRRDPFVSLAERRRNQEGGPARPPGVPGLLIDEVDLKGLFEIGGDFVAQIQAADSEKSYLLRAGDQLFDGQVVRITMSEVVFKQVVNDPGILKPFREVVKKLNP